MRGLAIALACATGGCSSLPFGETMVVIDTDAPVPQLVARVQLDFYADDGTWYESRQIGTPAAADWPLSFGVVTDGADKTAHLRIRAFPEGALRDYRGEVWTLWPPFVEPPIPANQQDLCAHAPLLPAGKTVTLRRGEQPITERIDQADCTYGTGSGSVAARVEVTAADTYRFEVIRAIPDGAHGDPAADTTLFLRTSCTDKLTQIACNDNIDEAAGDYLSRFEVALQPGTYWLITGGGLPSPADLTLRWAAVSQWDVPPAPSVPPGPTPAGGPRLIVDGADVTPAEEPQPNLSIDRLLDVPVTFGQHREVRVLLAAECDGTQADLLGRASCHDTAGIRLPVERAAAVDQVDRTSSATGSWAAAQPSPCTVAPRSGSSAPDGTPLHDEEICVPGGAMILGSSHVLSLEKGNAVPEQPVVVAPFLIDKYEVTVGRFRRALRDGFTSPDPPYLLTPLPNDGPLGAPGRSLGREPCTFNGDVSGPAPGIAREEHPISCVTWYTARELCRFLGGDLPTAVQWEYAAKAAGRDHATVYAWGDDPPDCSNVWFGGHTTDGCAGRPWGPIPVDQKPFADRDVTPIGVVGMGGNVSEWVGDSLRPFTDACWWQSPLREVACNEAHATRRWVRGASWDAPLHAMPVAIVEGEAPGYDYIDVGVRCVRRGTP